MRRSTGRLCLDLTPSDIPAPAFYFLDSITRPVSFMPFDNPDQEDKFIAFLGFNQYSRLCYWFLQQTRVLPISHTTEVNMGAVVCCPSGARLDGAVHIASLTGVEPEPHLWRTDEAADGEFIVDGWTRYFNHFRTTNLTDPVEYLRYDSCDVFNTVIRSRISTPQRECWLSEMNYILRRLQITSNDEDYGGI